MQYCPECGCLLDETKGVVLCAHCNYSECRCEQCSSQDEIKEVLADVEQDFSNGSMKLKGGDIHVE